MEGTQDERLDEAMGTGDIPQANSQLLAMMSRMLDERLTAHKEEMHMLFSNRPQQREAEKRRITTEVDEHMREARRQALTEAGLTSAEAIEVLNRQAAGPTTSGLPTSTRQHHFKPENIGIFEGDPLDLPLWIGRVESLWDANEDPAYRQPLLNALPYCLTKSAAIWYQYCTREFRQQRLSTWEGWCKELQNAFSLDKGTIRRLAAERKWSPRHEELIVFLYHKLALERMAWPHRDEEDLVDAISDGLPADLQLSVRTGLNKDPKLNTLINELQKLEPIWRKGDPSSRGRKFDSKAAILGPQKDTTSANQKTATLKIEPRATASRPAIASGAPGSASRPSLRDSYDRSRISFDSAGNRLYRLPPAAGKGVLTLNQNCATCGQRHFRFECGQNPPSGPTLKKEPVGFIEGYPVIQAEIITLDDDDEMSDAEAASIHTVDSSTGSQSQTTSPDASPSPQQGKEATGTS
ncbi:unnamed protein product [Jaminaea pallidilutea]